MGPINNNKNKLNNEIIYNFYPIQTHTKTENLCLLVFFKRFTNVTNINKPFKKILYEKTTKIIRYFDNFFNPP